MTRSRLFVFPLTALLLSPFTAAAQVTPQDYERALGLRAEWEHLTIDVPDPAVWSDAERFHYRKTVLGGQRFVTYDVGTRAGREAFDHEALAASLSRATGGDYSALRLPFSTFRYVDGRDAIAMRFGGSEWRCDLSGYECQPAEPAPASGPRPRPSSFGVVRDMEVPADTTPLVSPDGRWEAVLGGHDLAVRRAGGGPLTRLSTDGTADDFYELSLAAWSPDSRMLATYRVRPGERRLVHYVEALPAGGVQPRHFSELYAKPGDRVDLEQPVVFHLDGPRRVDVPNDLFPNPYSLLALEWRRDGRALTFEYNQRGHQVYRVIEVDPHTGVTRAVITEEAETFFNHRAATGTLLGGGTYFRHDVDDGREIVWLSERDGWKHLYLYDGEMGEVKNQITRGEWVVRGVVHVDDQARQIWFQAGGMNPEEDPYFVHYYRVGFDGSGLTPLTHHAAAYHDVRFSPDMSCFVDTSMPALTARSSPRRSTSSSLTRPAMASSACRRWRSWASSW